MTSSTPGKPRPNGTLLLVQSYCDAMTRAEGVMRLATVVLVMGLGLPALPAQAQDVDLGEIFGGIGRALSSEEERERTDRRGRYEEYDRSYEEDQERGADYSYGERYDPQEDRFWSEEATRLDYERMSNEERRRYDSMNDEERRRFEEDAGYARRDWYEERASDEARERYDQALQDMEDEIWRERRRR
jgi:hypothetical protein